MPRDLETIVLKAMDKEPDRRYSSAELLAKDLRRFVEHDVIEARPLGLARKVARRVQRHKVRTILGAAVVVLSVTAGALAIGGRSPAPPVPAKPHPDDLLAPAEVLKKARSLALEGRFKESAATTKLLLERQMSLDALHMNARALRHVDLAASCASYKRAVELNPNNVAMHHGYGATLLGLRRFAVCLEASRDAIRRFPAKGAYRRREVTCLLELGRPAEARRRAAEHLSARFKSPADRGYLLVVAGRERQARALLERGRGLEFVRVLAYGTLGDRDAALRWLRKMQAQGRRLTLVEQRMPEMRALAEDPEIGRLVLEMREAVR